VEWVKKLASQDWSAFENGSVNPMIASARWNQWQQLIAACRGVVDSYEKEYLRRLYWITEPIVAEDDTTPERRVYKVRMVEKGAPDRVVLELRFDTGLPGISFVGVDPVEFSGVIALVLDEQDIVHLAFRNQIVSPEQMTKILLAPILFKVGVFLPGLLPDLDDQISLQNAYDDAIRRLGPSPRRSVVQEPRALAPPSKRQSWKSYLLATLIVAAATGLEICLLKLSDPSPLLLLFAVAVSLVVIRWGIGPGVCALCLAVLSTDYFFIEPLYQISLNNTVCLFALIYTAFGVLCYWIASTRRPALAADRPKWMRA
jgi:hypothetical protein